MQVAPNEAPTAQATPQVARLNDASDDAADEALCRVCHCPAESGTVAEESSGQLLSPCLCDGSVRWVHRRCLNHWRLQGAQRALRSSHCELCNFAYRYEVKWTSRGEQVSRVLGRCCLGAVLLGSTAALASWATSASRGASLVGAALAIAALSDMLPWRMSDNLCASTSHRLVELASLPAGEATKAAEAEAQARAGTQAERVVHMMARNQAQRAMYEEQTEVELTDARPSTQDAADVFERDNIHAAATTVTPDNVESQGRSGAERASSSASSSSFANTDDTNSVGERRARRWALLSRRCVCFVAGISLAVVGACGYAWIINNALASTSGARLVPLLAWSGAIYWTVACALMLMLAACGPVTCEPVRGPDGFFLVRSLGSEERLELVA